MIVQITCLSNASEIPSAMNPMKRYIFYGLSIFDNHANMQTKLSEYKETNKMRKNTKGTDRNA